MTPVVMLDSGVPSSAAEGSNARWESNGKPYPESEEAAHRLAMRPGWPGRQFCRSDTS